MVMKMMEDSEDASAGFSLVIQARASIHFCNERRE